MRGLAAAIAVLAFAGAAAGSLLVKSPIAVNPAAAVPVTLAAGAAGTTTVGASATSATTSATLPLLNGLANVLTVVRGTQDWSVRLVLDGVSGDILTDTVTVNLVGSVTETQVIVRNGADQVSGNAVTLAAAGPDVTVAAFGTCLGSCVLSMHFELAPAGSASPALRYAYTLTVT